MRLFFFRQCESSLFMCYFCDSIRVVKVFDGLESDIDISGAHVTIGTFDGVHVGHQKIIHKLNQRAVQHQGESVLFTFDPHPRNVLNPSEPVRLIQTRQEKLDKLQRLGLQNVILFPFTKAFSKTPAEIFIREFLVDKLKMQAVVIGYDHQFGRNREGSLEHFQVLGKTLGFEVEEIPAQDIDDIHVSSTKIRAALKDGQVQIANKYLGEPFQLNGKVDRGQSIGKTLGYPTANLKIDNPYKILPCSGVYLVRCSILGEICFGMMNIGNRPTIDTSLAPDLSIEVHIFDFEKNIYGHELQVELLEFVRYEFKFNGNNELIEQLRKDEAFCRDRSSHYALQSYSI